LVDVAAVVASTTVVDAAAVVASTTVVDVAAVVASTTVVDAVVVVALPTVAASETSKARRSHSTKLVQVLGRYPRDHGSESSEVVDQNSG
jgi:hypothetical protein